MSYGEAKLFVEDLKNAPMVAELVDCVGSFEMAVLLQIRVSRLLFTIVL